MATQENIVLPDAWLLVSDKTVTVQVLIGSCHVSIGDEPAADSTEGFILGLQNGEKVFQFGDKDDVWVKPTVLHPKCVITSS